MIKNFAYTDERDKCYGITGIVVSLDVLDNEGMVQSIDIDDEDALTFTPDFFFCSNPRYSAKLAWNETLKQYQLLVGMVMSNIMSRYCVKLHRQLTPDIIRQMHDLIADEGRDACSLDDDEIDTVFNKTFRYLNEVFANAKIQYIVDKFARYLQQHRQLSCEEINDQLHILRH